MLSRSRPFLTLLLLLLIATILFVLWRGTGRADYGSAVAICPGPDQYGYTCTGGGGFAYIDATQDTRLYADDGVIQLPLPFPFIYYGTTYTSISVSSNGTLQFDGANASYRNGCMDQGPVADMGDMIAPYWDDLDLRSFGFLEYDVVGSMPDRIFVIEWDDVPHYGDESEDRVTFEVQLFETSNDILFLYQDVSAAAGYHGSGATIGLQSEAQGAALQYSCSQPAVADSSGILFPHPVDPNRVFGREVVLPAAPGGIDEVAAKGDVAVVIDALALNGRSALPDLRTGWMNAAPRKAFEWRWTDLDGDRRDDLLVVWHGGRNHPELSQMAVLQGQSDGSHVLLRDERLSTRTTPFHGARILGQGDFTADGTADLLVSNEDYSQMFVLSHASGQLMRYTLPSCTGSWKIESAANEPGHTVLRESCGDAKRASIIWTGSQFVVGDQLP